MAANHFAIRICVHYDTETPNKKRILTRYERARGKITRGKEGRAVI